MTLCLKQSLAKLEKLSPQKLHQTNARIRAELGGAEWKMGLCLLATARTKGFRKLGYSNLTEYAEKALQLSGKKAGCLLGAARALEHLPLMSEAFRNGKLCWGKLRALQSVATPDTEAQWLEYASLHHTDLVARKVALSPSEWKRQRALAAARASSPIATPELVAEILRGEDAAEARSKPASTGSRPAASSPLAGVGAPVDVEHLLAESAVEASSPSAKGGAPSLAVERAANAELAGTPTRSLANGELPPAQSTMKSEEPATPSSEAEMPLPLGPKSIRLVFLLTPDQFMSFEAAERRIRSQLNKRCSRAMVLARMSEIVLEAGTAKSRAKHQILIHTLPETGQVWYESERGPLPVDPEVLRQARESGPPALEISSPLFPPDLNPGNPIPPDPNPGEPTVAATPPPERPFKGGPTTAIEGQRVEGRLVSDDNYDKSGNVRRAIPADVLRKLFAQAGHRCERCQNASGPFDVHHRQPVSEGGQNELPELQLLCQSCHTMKHEQDYASKPDWAAARAARQAARPEARPEASSAARPAARPEASSAARPEARQAARPEARPAARPAARPEASSAAKPAGKEVQAASDDDEYQEPAPNRRRFPVRDDSLRPHRGARLWKDAWGCKVLLYDDF